MARSPKAILEEGHVQASYNSYWELDQNGGGEDFPIFQPIRNHGGRLGCMARTVETILEESHVEATVSYNSYWE
jgi:hypothetical protein